MTPSTILPAATVLLATLAAAPLGAVEAGQESARGAKVYAENCGRCHQIPDPASRDAKAWRPIALHMRMLADLSAEEQHVVLVFLRTYDTAAMTKRPGLPATR